jgi:hypothetical protein
MNNRTLTIISLVSTSILVGTSASALAESPNMVRKDAMPAIRGGLEIAMAATTSMSVGDIGGDMADAEDLIGTAGEIELHVGHRVTPNLMLGFYGTAQGLSEGSADSDRDIWGGTAGLEASFHARPYNKIDPWISVGSGLRGLWIQEPGPGDSVLVGLELARVQLGTDFRVNEDFAVSPVISASASMFGAHKTPTMDFDEISGKGVTWTFSAGLAGRFNAFGSRE